MTNSADPDQLASFAKAGYSWVQQDKLWVKVAVHVVIIDQCNQTIR